MYWYVLFTKTGREKKVEQFLKKSLDKDLYVPFIPVQETLFKISGQVKKEIKPLFPSYVFIESEISGLEFVKRTSSLFFTSNDIIMLLKYDNTMNEIAMREEEKNLLSSLYNDHYCIEASSGIIVGNTVYINEGPLKGRESLVKKIDRHKRNAIIEMYFMSSIRQLSVPLEIVSKM